MNIPRLVSSNFPYLPVQIDVDGDVRDIEALLDTGFDGDLVLPEGLVPNPTAAAIYSHWTLADGSDVRAPSYIANIRVGDFGPFVAVITIVGNEPLLGRSLTDRFRITLDHGRQVIVEP